MIFYFQTNYCRSITIYWYYCILVLIINPAHSQYIYQSLSVISSQGTQLLPVNSSAQLISSTLTESKKLCATACNSNTFCRIFDYGAIVPQQCRLFEGDIYTLGTIIPSSMPDSIVGTIQMTPSLFTQYGQACSSVCLESRYLTCGNHSTCECMPHTYWNASIGMCRAQSPILGASCEQGINMCREDLNYTCLQFNQCGPLPLLSGTTIADISTIIWGSATVGLNIPVDIITYGAENESLIVVDMGTQQLVQIQNMDLNNRSISVLARNWSNGSTFGIPSQIFLDLKNANNFYVSDYFNNVVILFYSMQTVVPPPEVVAGVSGSFGSTLDKFNGPQGIALDNEKNLFVADEENHRIMRWTPNATSGILIAGQGLPGNDSMSFNGPRGMFLDQDNSLLYVADRNNHRIQLLKLDGTPPYTATTVAGGNGQGSGNDQLNNPISVWVSRKTGAIYIADAYNNRIQRWNPGATSGVTIAGNPDGIAGVDSTKLYFPFGLTINANETRMYVCDTLNSRIQRFDLI